MLEEGPATTTGEIIPLTNYKGFVVGEGSGLGREDSEDSNFFLVTED